MARDFSARHVYAKVPRRVVDQIHDEQRIAGEALSEFGDEEIWQIGPDPSPTGPTESLDMTEAIGGTLHQAFAADRRIVALGEDVALEGGVFRVTEGLLDAFGSDRVIDTPLCELGIIGTSVGMAMAGLRPVPEIEFAGFVYTAFDQIVGHVARTRWRYRGAISMPMVIRLPVGTGIDAYEFHVDTPEAYFAHTPGLTIVYPSDPYDARGLMWSALASEDPVLFFEPIALYRGLKRDVPVERYDIPIGSAAIKRAGSDVTVVAYGPPVHAALAAAASLETEGVSAEIIDLRTIAPWDHETVLDSVIRTGRLVTVHEAALHGGLGAEIVASVMERAAYAIETPPVRVGHADYFWGPTQLERFSLITKERIADGIRRVMRGDEAYGGR